LHIFVQEPKYSRGTVIAANGISADTK